MQHKFTTREYVLAGAFALMAAFPLVTDASLDVPLAGSVTGDAVRRAYHDRAAQSQLRRMRWSVLKDCAQREAAGEEGACPDVNDVRALYDYWTPAVHEAAPEEAITASMEDLGDFEKGVLRKAGRIGACPANLDALVPGFQELCERTVDKHGRDADAINEAARDLLGKPSNR